MLRKLVIMPILMGHTKGITMQVVNQYKQNLLDNYCLDEQENVRYKNNGYRGRYKKGDLVKTFKMNKLGYLGVHVSKARATVSLAHLKLLLSGVDIKDNEVVDHIDGNPLNNSLSNLRVITQALNCRNSDRKVGVSGEKFITKLPNGSYRVRLRFDGKRNDLGIYKTIAEAIKVRDSHLHKCLNEGFTKRHCK